MHKEITEFFLFVKQQLWEFFMQGSNVLDIGSGDYNGNNRQFFDPSCNYQGNDVFPGRNVDLLYKTSELPFYKPTFTTIISSECFQHDPDYVESLRKAVSILTPGGLLVFTCASTGREEHGTKKVLPSQSFGTKGRLSKWMNYYKNLTFEDIAKAIPLENIFSVYRCYYNTASKDLMFWGIKKGTSFNFSIVEYTGSNIQRIAPLEPPKPKSNGIETVNYDELTEEERYIVDMVSKQRSN